MHLPALHLLDRSSIQQTLLHFEVHPTYVDLQICTAAQDLNSKQAQLTNLLAISEWYKQNVGYVKEIYLFM